MRFFLVFSGLLALSWPMFAAERDARKTVQPKDLLTDLWPSLTPGEVRQAVKARALFDQLMRLDDPVDSRPWRLLLRNAMAELACLERFPAALNDQRDAKQFALALRVLGALDLEAQAGFLAALALRDHSDPYASFWQQQGYARQIREYKTYAEQVRRAAEDALLALDIQTPQPVLDVLARSPSTDSARAALDILRRRPDEAGLFAIVQAVDRGNSPGAAPSRMAGRFGRRGGSVSYDQGQPPPVTRSEFQKAFRAATGMSLPGKGKAAAWWNEHKAEALERAAEVRAAARTRGLAPLRKGAPSKGSPSEGSSMLGIFIADPR